VFGTVASNEALVADGVDGVGAASELRRYAPHAAAVSRSNPAAILRRLRLRAFPLVMVRKWDTA
jgi:hypothetical protein